MSEKTTYRGVQLLPAAPIRDWLTGPMAHVTDLEFERCTGVSARIVFRLRRGDQTQVSLDIADRLTLYSGSPRLLNELYPVSTRSGKAA